MKYCCIEGYEDRKYTKVIEQSGQHYKAYRLHHPATTPWLIPVVDPADKVRRWSKFWLVDCGSCKHKLTCLVNKQAVVSFERA